MVIFKNKKKNMQQVEEKHLHQSHFPDSKNLGTEKPSSSTATATSTSRLKQPLHNFSLPCDLRWGNQKFLRCMKAQEISSIVGQCGGNNDGLVLGKDFGDRRSGGCGGLEEDDSDSYYLNCEDGLERKKGLGFEGIGDVGEMVSLDLQNAGDEMKDAVLGRGVFGDEERVQPWNLRTRRAMNRPEGGVGGVGGSGEVKDLKLDVIKNSVDGLKKAGETMSRRRSGAGSPSGEKKEREKFSVALGRREIEEDFVALVGHKPPRRPKKRAKYVQKQLDTLCPGFWLTEITADMYKVTETG